MVISGDLLTAIPVVERLEEKLSLPVLKSYVCPGWDSNTQSSASEFELNDSFANIWGVKLWFFFCFKDFEVFKLL